MQEGNASLPRIPRAGPAADESAEKPPSLPRFPGQKRVDKAPPSRSIISCVWQLLPLAAAPSSPFLRCNSCFTLQQSYRCPPCTFWQHREDRCGICL